MKVLQLIQALQLIDSALPNLDVVVPNQDEPRQWDFQIARLVETRNEATGRCKNCKPECPGDKFLHAGADDSGPCTGRGCNPHCVGWDPEVKKVVVIE